MTRIGDRSIDEDHGLQVDKIYLAYIKQLELSGYLISHFMIGKMLYVRT